MLQFKVDVRQPPEQLTECKCVSGEPLELPGLHDDECFSGQPEWLLIVQTNCDCHVAQGIDAGRKPKAPLEWLPRALTIPTAPVSRQLPKELVEPVASAELVHAGAKRQARGADACFEGIRVELGEFECRLRVGGLDD